MTNDSSTFILTFIQVDNFSASGVHQSLPKLSFIRQVDGSHIGTIYDTVSKLSGSTSGEEYGADGSLTVSITVDLSNEAQLRQTLMDATRGEVIYLDESQNES